MTLALALAAGCVAEPTGGDGGGVDGLWDGKTDSTTNFEFAWDPPRTLQLGVPLADQVVAFDMEFDGAETVTRDEHVDDDGTINIDVVIHSDAVLLFEVGRYFLDVERDGPVRIEPVADDPEYGAVIALSPPGETQFEFYDDVVELDPARAGGYRISVMMGRAPTLSGTFSYTMTATAP